MPLMRIKSSVLEDGQVYRRDLNTTLGGEACITRVFVGQGLTASWTGQDVGTGDVTVGVAPDLTLNSLTVGNVLLQGSGAATTLLKIKDTSGVGYPNMFQLEAGDSSDPTWRFNRVTQSYGDFRVMLRGGNGNNWLAIHSHDKTDSQLIIHSNGNVGIGIAPLRPLHLLAAAASDGVLASFNRTGSEKSFDIQSLGSADIFLRSDGSIKLQAGATLTPGTYDATYKQLVLSTNGNVGVSKVPASNEALGIEFADGNYGIHFTRGATDLGGFHANSGVPTFETGTGATLRLNGFFDACIGARGGMGLPYEAMVLQKNADTKLGVYSSATVMSGASSSVTLGASNVTMSNGRYPGFEFQHIPSATVASNKVRFNWIERNAAGSVTVALPDILVIQADGKVGVNVTPTEAFDVNGASRFRGDAVADSGYYFQGAHKAADGSIGATFSVQFKDKDDLLWGLDFVDGLLVNYYNP